LNKEDVFKAVNAACIAMDDKFGKDIAVLDISEISPLADYFIIVTGMNPSQTEAMTEACEKAFYANGLPLIMTEGAGTGWFLMDYGAAIVHIFDRELRDFYNIERIWSDAKKVDIKIPAVSAPQRGVGAV